VTYNWGGCASGADSYGTCLLTDSETGAGKTLGRMRRLIQQVDPDVVEEWRRTGTPVWSHDKIICTGESYKSAVKLTFAKGAFLKDPAGLFNSSLEGNTRRAMDIHEGEAVDESAFKALVRQAVASTVLASRNLRRKRVQGIPPLNRSSPGRR
jgi:hypothetical protein